MRRMQENEEPIKWFLENYSFDPHVQYLFWYGFDFHAQRPLTPAT